MFRAKIFHRLQCVIAWGNTYQTSLQPLFVLQKKAIVVAFDVCYFINQFNQSMLSAFLLSLSLASGSRGDCKSDEGVTENGSYQSQQLQSRVMINTNINSQQPLIPHSLVDLPQNKWSPKEALNI